MQAHHPHPSKAARTTARRHRRETVAPSRCVGGSRRAAAVRRFASHESSRCETSAAMIRVSERVHLVRREEGTGIVGHTRDGPRLKSAESTLDLGGRRAMHRQRLRGARNPRLDATRPRAALQNARPARTPKSTSTGARENMPSVASFMIPAAKCVTAMPEDKLSSVVASLVNERIGCVVVVDPASERAVGIVTKQDVNRMFLNQVRPAVRRGHRHRTPTRRGRSTRPPGGVFPARRSRRA